MPKRKKTDRKRKGEVKKEIPKKEQAIDQNKILRNFFIGMAILILLIILVVDGKNAEYNFYLRNDPRKLDEGVSFNGNLSLAQNLVLNSTEDFNCDGFGIIATANLVNLYKVSGINVIKDQNATCDSEGRYAFINLQKGSETRIDKVGPACYNVNISNCEILEATERLMLESFIEINKLM